MSCHIDIGCLFLHQCVLAALLVISSVVKDESANISIDHVLLWKFKNSLLWYLFSLCHLILYIFSSSGYDNIFVPVKNITVSLYFFITIEKSIEKICKLPLFNAHIKLVTEFFYHMHRVALWVKKICTFGG